mgnify:CR=1 FL=1
MIKLLSVAADAAIGLFRMGDCHSAFRRLALRGRGPPPEGQRQIRPPAPAQIVRYAGCGGSRRRDHVPCLHQRDVGVPERFAVLGNVKPRLSFRAMSSQAGPKKLAGTVSVSRVSTRSCPARPRFRNAAPAIWIRNAS